MRERDKETEVSWLKRLEKAFAVKVRATVFAPSSDRWTENENRHEADAREFLLCMRDYAKQFAATDGALFALDYRDVFDGPVCSSEFKAHLFTEASNYGLECVAVTDYKACFRHIA